MEELSYGAALDLIQGDPTLWVTRPDWAGAAVGWYIHPETDEHPVIAPFTAKKAEDGSLSVYVASFEDQAAKDWTQVEVTEPQPQPEPPLPPGKGRLPRH
ncbi:hypothetical protein ABZ543_13240 [Streptomyces roseifaciens]